jgi:hypothetical protein
MTRALGTLSAVLVAGVVAGLTVRADEPPKVNGAPAANWSAQLREWRKWYTQAQRDVSKTREAAQAALEAIDDPAIIGPIVSLLKTEKHGQFRRALLRPLIRLGGKEAVAALVKWSVEDDNPVLRQEAAEGLVGKPELPQFLDQYIEYLRNPKFAANSAQALRWTKLAVRESSSEPLNEKLTKALIDALVQKQKKRVPYWVAVDTGWLRDASGERFGRHREYEEGLVDAFVFEPNPEVHATLKSYSGEDYQFEQRSWVRNLSPKWRRE